MEKQYLELVEKILAVGDDRLDRTGVGTRALFGQQLRFDLARAFPAITTKKLAWKAVVSELLWFVEGSGSERRLAEILHGTRSPEKTTIWTDNANAEYWKPKAHFEGDLGRVYGVQWRSWNSTRITRQGEDWLSHPDGSSTFFNSKVNVKSIDQLANVINKLKTDPTDRRMIMTAFNVGEIDQMALPPCHMMVQFFVNQKYNTLSAQVYMRSVDVALGLPFNIASYALLTHMIAQVAGLGVGELVMTMGDTHIYNNHFDGITEQLSRSPLAPPRLWLNPDIKDIDTFTMGDIRLEDYHSYSPIKMEMAV